MSSNDTLHLLLTGLAAGDSLGSTSEFCSRSEVEEMYARYSSEGWPLRQVGGGKYRWNPGEPTDDTDMALCLVNSWKDLGRFDGANVARRFVLWKRSRPKDIGNTTQSVLNAIQHGLDWTEAGRKHSHQHPESLANGSLMRNGVVAGMADSLDKAWEITLLHGLITHYAPLCQLCCAAQTWMIWTLLKASPLPSTDWILLFRPRFMDWLNTTTNPMLQRWREDVSPHLDKTWGRLTSAEWNLDKFDPFKGEIQNIGFVLTTLQIAWWALQWSLRPPGSFTAPANLPVKVFEHTGPWVLAWVAMIGADSDTYGATAGPLIAAAHGGLPPELTRGLHILKSPPLI